MMRRTDVPIWIKYIPRGREEIFMLTRSSLRRSTGTLILRWLRSVTTMRVVPFVPFGKTVDVDGTGKTSGDLSGSKSNVLTNEYSCCPVTEVNINR